MVGRVPPSTLYAHCSSLAVPSADYAALSKSLMKKGAIVLRAPAAPMKAPQWKQAIYLPAAMTFPAVLLHAQYRPVVMGVAVVAEVAVMAEEVEVVAVVDQDGPEAVAAEAAVTEAGAAVVVMAAEDTPAAVAACLAKAIPRAAVTNKLFALQHGV